MQRLPNWKLLTAFEAVARTGQFSRAAAELNVQQPAISRCVAQLEAEIGTALVIRSRPDCHLTTEGEILYRALSSGLSLVAGALDQIQSRRRGSVLTINTTIGFANCFLMRRLGAFQALEPDATVELVTRDWSSGYRDGREDIVILFSEPATLPGVEARRIFPEELIAVKSPDYPLTGAGMEALGTARLLRLTPGIHTNDWDRYFAGTGQNARPDQPTERFNSFMVYLQATLSGRGVSLGWRHLMDDLLEAGQLELAAPHRARTERGYFCCLTQSGATRPEARAFMEWLCDLVPRDEDAATR